jgi:Mg2+/Co2+ transporter CorB
VGVIQAKDLLLALQRARGNTDMIEIAKVIREPWYIPESTALLDQLRAFQRRREHFALVVDEYGSFQGVVTLEDILEEIVGDIQERHEQTASGIHAAGDGAYVVKGELPVRDLNRELGWNLPEEQAATVAGLVMHEAQRIPEVRQVFAFHGFRFEILRKKNNRIVTVRIAPLEPPAGDGSAAPADRAP